MTATAQIREGIRPGSGLYFYDCPECPCSFGAMTRDRAVAEREAADHDAEFHAEPEPPHSHATDLDADTCPACFPADGPGKPEEGKR
jgi:hypothetical protein